MPLKDFLMIRQTKKAILRALDACGYELRHKEIPKDELKEPPKEELTKPYTLDLYSELFPASSLKTKSFYNFGSGNWRHPCWTNVDYDSDYYGYKSDLIDIHWDIVSGHPVRVENNTAELVYCSHTVEHLQDHHVDNMLAEAYRILKPGGVIRVTTPNAALFYWAYKRRDRYFNFHYGHDFPFGDGYPTYSIQGMSLWVVNEIATQLVQGVRGEERIGAQLLGQIDTIDRIFDEHKTMESAFSKICGMVDFELQREVPGQHINWWTNERLCDAYRRAGFQHVIPNVAGGSISPVMRDTKYFDIVDPTFSIFVDAIK
jgi:predicted SAM-dependent methyltransferase